MLRSHGNAAILAGVALTIGIVHVAAGRVGEPFYNNDETRHVMTGVFFRDFFRDLPLSRVVGYTTDYYLQYPALGLIVWPPLFYVVEGLAMLAFGNSFLVAKALIGVFVLMAVAYLFLTVERTHGVGMAASSALIFGFAPLVFGFSRQVMLEMPCLAFSMASIHHFLAYLAGGRRRDLWISAFASAMAALTRFDAVYLLPTFLIVLATRGKMGLLWRREVLAAGLVALMLVMPAYAISAREFGSGIRQSALVGTSADDPGFLAWSSVSFYPRCLTRQLGAVPLGLALIGIVVGLAPSRRPASWPYLAMIAATYLTFTPLGEVESRHAIYWIPAFALFAAEGARWLVGRTGLPVLFAPLVACVVLMSAWSDCREPAPYLIGYESAARYVAEHSNRTRVCFFDGSLDGNFIYQLRRHDPARRHWILRGDKVLYTTLITADVAYVEYAKSDREIVETLHRFDPDLIVVEEPALPNVPLASRLRETLRTHPERFRREAEFPLDHNRGTSLPRSLIVYRSLVRNDRPERRLDVPMLGLGRSLQATMPKP